jgi:biopolymer transport protein TolR
MIVLPKRAKSKIDAQINIVPYIDVMLVLLVIFMMTTPIIEQGVEVDLPVAEANRIDLTEQYPTIITIDKNGKYFINSLNDENINEESAEELSLDIVISRVKARLEVFPLMKIFVAGDREVAYESVVLLMSFLQKNGVEKVGIVTESADTQ